MRASSTADEHEAKSEQRKQHHAAAEQKCLPGGLTMKQSREKQAAARVEADRAPTRSFVHHACIAMRQQQLNELKNIRSTQTRSSKQNHED
jgi:hypothetical protein